MHEFYPPSVEDTGSSATLRPCTYPARPVNGGPLERALPKSGQWHYEPKYNGWRALVHAPTGTMFNRYGQRLTIQREFSAALAALRALRLGNGAGIVEWYDCEALERRHALGRGALLVFDYIGSDPYLRRKQRLAEGLAVHDYAVPPRSDCACSVGAAAPGDLDPLEFYRRLKQLNGQWGCPFYEGVVAKRADSPYPVQLRKEDMTTNRLTVVGPASDLKQFDRNVEWTAELGARHIELLENSADRHSWQFETDEPPLKFLKTLSRRWRSLTFLLDYDWEDKSIKGLAKAKAGRLRNYSVTY